VAHWHIDIRYLCVCNLRPGVHCSFLNVYTHMQNQSVLRADSGVLVTQRHAEGRDTRGDLCCLVLITNKIHITEKAHPGNVVMVSCTAMSACGCPSITSAGQPSVSNKRGDLLVECRSGLSAQPCLLLTALPSPPQASPEPSEHQCRSAAHSAAPCRQPA
jgi:hypothetical protein